MNRHWFRMGFMAPLLLLLTLTLNGCGALDAGKNVENSKQLRVGMTKEEVKKIMGSPLDVRYATDDLWYYYVDARWFDGQYTRDECMPLVFKDGKLTGWGNDYYNKLRMTDREYARPVIEGLR